ncbi:MAG TPA: hypothetical protein DEB17_09215 [Chlorobaculum sp.]|uniref:Uncharacterized protein n=1 Tax=Chlorobaculum tepidum (strain ATCC 49652 / DSM 12025 / NBRC 103806 / TLS) TaxID=194439 RepID=Q8KB87_CHLTE|nr:hypothetical protein CT1902 [Chlorobaculum tepidum TLS]HBU24146.1 hypothetical protein [Chlorobaculum sp.]
MKKAERKSFLLFDKPVSELDLTLNRWLSRPAPDALPRLE